MFPFCEYGRIDECSEHFHWKVSLVGKKILLTLFEEMEENTVLYLIETKEYITWSSATYSNNWEKLFRREQFPV